MFFRFTTFCACKGKKQNIYLRKMRKVKSLIPKFYNFYFSYSSKLKLNPYTKSRKKEGFLNVSLGYVGRKLADRQPSLKVHEIISTVTKYSNTVWRNLSVELGIVLKWFLIMGKLFQTNNHCSNFILISLQTNSWIFFLVLENKL